MPVSMQPSFVQLTEQLAMLPNMVGYVSFDCHARLGEELHEGCYEDGCDLVGSLDAYWTGEIDNWGKLTIKPVDGTSPHYLFPDEIVDVEY